RPTSCAESWSPVLLHCGGWLQWGRDSRFDRRCHSPAWNTLSSHHRSQWDRGAVEPQRRNVPSGKDLGSWTGRRDSRHRRREPTIRDAIQTECWAIRWARPIGGVIMRFVKLLTSFLRQIRVSTLNLVLISFAFVPAQAQPGFVRKDFPVPGSFLDSGA